MAAYKLLPYFLFPTTWVILLMVAALILLWRRSTAKAGIALFAAIALLWVFASPRVSAFLLGSLEAFYPPQAIEALPQADAIVLLGGGVELAAPPRMEPDLNEAADRLWYAARLYHAGKAPLIIVSGGQVFPQLGLKTEAEYHVDLLLQLGVPRKAIVLEMRARNTEENATFIAQLMHERLQSKTSAITPPQVLLTTSAAHQPRAMLLFEQAGLLPTAATCDVQIARLQQPWLLEMLPSASALSKSEGAIREWIGYLAYRLIDRRLLDLLRS